MGPCRKIEHFRNVLQNLTTLLCGVKYPKYSCIKNRAIFIKPHNFFCRVKFFEKFCNVKTTRRLVVRFLSFC